MPIFYLYLRNSSQNIPRLPGLGDLLHIQYFVMLEYWLETSGIELSGDDCLPYSILVSGYKILSWQPYPTVQPNIIIINKERRTSDPIHSVIE